MTNRADQANRAHRRQGVALVVTLLLVLLLTAVTTRLVTTGGVEAVCASRRAHTLQHRLAVDSVLRLAAAELQGNSVIDREYTRAGTRAFDLELGPCRVRCRIANDAAKLNVKTFEADGRQQLLTRKLQELGRRLNLPAATVKLRPSKPPKSGGSRTANVSRYCWYDQLFREATGGAWFRWGVDAPGPEALVWSDVVTLFGDDRVDVRHARPEVLQVLLEDLDRSVAGDIIAARESGRPANVLESGLEGVEPTVREGIRQRLTASSQRYALTIETAIHGDRRQWYVVATIDDGRVQTVHYRGQVQW
jgi:Tfp pilus assembly protein PilX